MKVVVGTNHLFEEDGQAYFAEEIIPHENYTATGIHDHDIALIKVDSYKHEYMLYKFDQIIISSHRYQKT